MNNNNENTFESYVVERDDKRPLRFKGEIIAEERWGTGAGTFTSLTLYKTSGANFVAACCYETHWQGCRDIYSAQVCKTHEEIIEFFGLSDIAKEIYANAEINYFTEVE